MALPRLMVAPNGARRTKADHPALPMTVPEIVETARACAAAGADGLHLHLRNEAGGHILDAGLYRDALVALRQAVPGIALQITTEAVGLYAAPHQREVALMSGADFVSAAVREMTAETPADVTTGFYTACHARGIAVQHILYEATELDDLARLLPEAMFRDPALQLIFVLGRYSLNQESDPSDLLPFLDAMSRHDLAPDWALCAFGRNETRCLVEGARRGGKMRVGFENSLWHGDGTLAKDNADRVRAVRAACV